MQSIALIADIHGNCWALERIFADIDQRGIKLIYDLGDTLYGPLAPQETFELLSAADIPSVCGNEDANLLTPLSALQNPTVAFTRNQLTPAALAWIEHSPMVRTTSELTCFHGSPTNLSEYYIEQVIDGKVIPYSQEILNQKTKGYTTPIVCCGHSHTPHFIRLSHSQWIVNPGSVGLQAYWDDIPASHFIERHTPCASYAVLQLDSPPQCEFINISYDWNHAANIAEQNGRKDWAFWLRTGTSSPSSSLSQKSGDL